MREAPAVFIIKELLKSGASVKAFDPEAMKTASADLPNITMAEDAYKVAEDADALIVCTEWKEFLSLDFERIKKLIKKPLIFDGRNCLNERTLNKLGFTYHAIGRPSA
jgi:UDPglucose 6-dehydrogenase